ncbi:hypothetical protein KIJ11_04985 [Leuconostoc gelidum subsp. gelidum]|uniref:Transposase n=1 Tax=Leuconostoc gelidum subsp. gelidum TaxID=1607839 RepID=A0ABS7V4W7_LEUGE|nr:hypothetical protein [Leuconostoc gelidum]MBZ5963444.1 hypothetical protein [Leuconostoc gelidum subsp. gelidum]MBZ5975157.1 hypothetical protein [Leuconostoc gelidum subsp. gelidum]MBZ5976893.1 hypothetical protein [Leuconostoc gelidum subsp. gelidum]MBZ6000019.1 hypothetical protein [Leuconostoc gelidum subsp. gelidum]
MTTDLATSTLQMALDTHQKPLIIHSDMGSQYTSAEFNIIHIHSKDILTTMGVWKRFIQF